MKKKNRGREKIYFKNLFVNMDNELYFGLKKKAEMDKTSMAQIIRYSARQYLKNENIIR